MKVKGVVYKSRPPSLESVLVGLTGKEVKALCHDLHLHYHASGAAYELRLSLEKILSDFEVP